MDDHNPSGSGAGGDHDADPAEAEVSPNHVANIKAQTKTRHKAARAVMSKRSLGNSLMAKKPAFAGCRSFFGRPLVH